MISLVLREYGAVNEGSPFISLEFRFTWVSHPFCLLVNPLGTCEAVMLTASLTNLGPLICRPSVHLASGETLFNVYTHSLGVAAPNRTGCVWWWDGKLKACLLSSHFPGAVKPTIRHIQWPWFPNLRAEPWSATRSTAEREGNHTVGTASPVPWHGFFNPRDTSIITPLCRTGSWGLGL